MGEGAYLVQIRNGGACMSKPSKTKKNKVPKITEEEYMAYVSALRELTGTEDGGKATQTPTRKSD